MITLQTPIAPAATASAARGQPNTIEAAASGDFAAVMLAMLMVSFSPAAVADTDAADRKSADATTDTKPGEQAQLAIESAIAPALPAPALATLPAQGAAAELVGDDPSRSSTVSLHSIAEAPRNRNPIKDLRVAPATDAGVAGDFQAIAPSPPDTAHGTTHGTGHESGRLPPTAQASEMAHPARQPELQPMQPTSRAAEMPMALAAPSPRIDAPLGTVRWRDDLSAHICVLVRNTVPEADIRVTPPELGPIHARISVDNGIATVVLSAPASETRDALEAALGTLRERLAENGLTLGEASVSGDRARQFEDRAAGFEDRATRLENRAARDALGGDAGNPSDSGLPADRSLRREGLVDLYV